MFFSKEEANGKKKFRKRILLRPCFVVNTPDMMVAQFLLFLCSLYFPIDQAVSNEDLLDLVVEVEGIKSHEGQILLALYDKEDFFLGTPVFREKAVQVNGKDSVHVVIRDLPKGIYAISLYHDKNSNHHLDTKIFGIPKEPYGFSNNARKAFRAPRFDEASFLLTQHGQIENIRVK